MFDAFLYLDQKKATSLIGVIDHCTMGGGFNFGGGRTKKSGLSARLTRRTLNYTSPTMANNKFIDLRDMGLELLYKMQHFIVEFDATNPDFRLELIQNAIEYKLKRWEKWTYEEVIEFFLTIRDRNGRFVCEEYEHKLRSESEILSARMNSAIDQLPILTLMDNGQLLNLGITKKRDQDIILKAIQKVTKGKEAFDDMEIIVFSDSNDSPGEAYTDKAAAPPQRNYNNSSSINTTRGGIAGVEGALENAQRFNIRDNMRTDDIMNNVPDDIENINDPMMAEYLKMKQRDKSMQSYASGVNVDKASVIGQGSLLYGNGKPSPHNYRQAQGQGQGDVSGVTGGYGGNGRGYGGYNPSMDSKSGQVRPMGAMGTMSASGTRPISSASSMSSASLNSGSGAGGMNSIANNKNKNKNKNVKNGTNDVTPIAPISPIARKEPSSKQNDKNDKNVKNGQSHLISAEKFNFESQQEEEKIRQQRKQQPKQAQKARRSRSPHGQTQTQTQASQQQQQYGKQQSKRATGAVSSAASARDSSTLIAREDKYAGLFGPNPRPNSGRAANGNNYNGQSRHTDVSPRADSQITPNKSNAKQGDK